jgi:ribosome-binding protein aMBF1 (putative translation factor)
VPVAKAPHRRKSPPKSSSAPTREEVDYLRRMVADLMRMAEDAREERQVQFKRMAQLQSELDSIRQAWEKVRLR